MIFMQISIIQSDCGEYRIFAENKMVADLVLNSQEPIVLFDIMEVLHDISAGS